MKRIAGRTLVVLVAVLLAIQLVPVDRSNPPVESEMPAPENVRAVLRRACYDCHSNETVWPWYSRVAPVSWLIARDVREGREELNFSTWSRLEPSKQRKLVRETWKEIEEGEMPPTTYLPLHPEARLSAEDRALVEAWARAEGPVPSGAP